MSDMAERTINSIRILAADTVQKAKSGHPGAPMGMAPLAYALYQHHLKANPADPKWPDRDRFVLSSGHASALIYSLLHLYGYGLTMDDMKQFRQWGSLTPGHPEYNHTVGVETTTGPLGQGVANAVGFAIAETMMAAHFNREGFPVVDHRTYAVCGDGCMIEGISSEAASLAGTLKLGKLTLLYDDNEISIEGNTDIAFREDVGARFLAYGWDVIRVKDGNDWTQVAAALEQAKTTDKPTLIICPTLIGFGCDAKAGTPGVHGEPLGEDNLLSAARKLGMPDEPFTVADSVYAHCAEAGKRGQAAEDAWKAMMAKYAAAYPELAKEFGQWMSGQLDTGLFEDDELWAFEGKIATRATSGEMINRLAKRLPNLVGGSADLAPSNKTYIKGGGDYSAENRAGRNLHFGVREHAMAAICNAICLHGGLHVFCGTFFVFSDYMRHSMRLSAIMKLPVTYVLTHDSIGVGEDGLTHEPIEHLASLRAMPDLLVFRPADGKETAAGWDIALNYGLPTALVLSRQNLPQYPGSGKAALKGGYILSDSAKAEPDVILMASGSEVEQVMQAQAILKEQGIDARVVSMPCLDLFERQDDAYKASVLPPQVRARVAMEAGCTMPWYKYTGMDGEVLGIDHYGASAPAAKLFEAFGFTADAVVGAAKRVLKK